MLSAVVNGSKKELIVGRIFWPDAKVERFENGLDVAFFDRVATATSSVSDTINRKPVADAYGRMFSKKTDILR